MFDTKQSSTRRALLAGAVGGLVLGGCALGSRLMNRSDPQAVAGPPVWYYEAWLNAKHLVPALKLPAGGSMTGRYDHETELFSWEVTVARLTGKPTVAFYGPATKRENAGVAFPLPPLEWSESSDFYTVSGSSRLTSAQLEDLQAERWYVLAVTPDYPKGETRGQIVRAVFRQTGL